MNDILRTLKIVTGGALIATGVVLLVLPGPGIPLIVGGVALLADEYAWAASLRTLAASLYQRARARSANEAAL